MPVIISNFNIEIDDDELIAMLVDLLAERCEQSFERTWKQLFVKNKPTMLKRFWRLLDKIVPNHPFRFLYICPDCGQPELTSKPPGLPRTTKTCLSDPKKLLTH